MKEDFYIQLIYKQLTEGLSTSDQGQLDVWLAAAPENRLTQQSIKAVWDASPNIKPEMEVDVATEFAALEALLEADEIAKPTATQTAKVRPLVKSQGRRRWMSVAAAILFIATIGFLLNQFLNTSPTTQWVEVQTQDATKTIQLADNSTVILNKNSTLKYPKEFLKDKRHLHLEGEAFFEVKRNPQKPFTVETSFELVRVLGTSFGVDARKEANTAQVEVVSGKVEVRRKGSNQKVILVKNERAIAQRTKQELTKERIVSSNKLAFATKQLKFIDTPLKQTLLDIQSVYNVQFKINKPQLEKCLFTANFTKQAITDIVATLATVLEIDVNEVQPNVYELSGGACE